MLAAKRPCAGFSASTVGMMSPSRTENLSAELPLPSLVGSFDSAVAAKSRSDRCAQDDSSLKISEYSNSTAIDFFNPHPLHSSNRSGGRSLNHLLQTVLQ